MTNKQMFETFLKAEYNRLDYTRGHYIVGYHENGLVFACVMDNFHFVEMAYVTNGSRNSGASLRYRQTKKAVSTLKAAATYIFPLCSEELLEEVAKDYGKQPNRGKAFEKLVTEYYGQTWEDDQVPFWEAGDIELNGQAYQIKYDRCNFCNEKQIMNKRAEGK